MWYCIPSEVHTIEKQTGPQAIKEHETPHGLARFAICVSRKGQQSKPFIQLTCRYIKMLDRMNVGWSVENPSSSLMWVTTPFVELMQYLGKKVPWFLFPQLHVWVAAEENDSYLDCVEEILQLHRICDDSHEHEAWESQKRVLLLRPKSAPMTLFYVPIGQMP